MAKNSKSVPQKETPSTSRWAIEENISSAATEESTPEPPLKMFVPTGCPIGADFKVEKTSSVLVVARMPAAVPQLKEWVEGIVSQKPYSERAWRKLWKGRSSQGCCGGEDCPSESPASRQGEEKKRKRAPSSPNSEKKKPKRRLVYKSKESTNAREIPSDSLSRLRDESEEEEEASELVARVQSDTKLPQTRVAGEEAVAEASEPETGEAVFPQAGEVDKETTAGASRAEDNILKDALGVIDLSESPSFTDSMINEAQMLKGRLNEGPQGVEDSFNNFFDGLDSTASEDVTGLGELPVPKKRPSSGANMPSSSPKLVSRFPAPSADPNRKRSIIMSIPEDARVLSTPMGVASYLLCLVTEGDQAKMDGVEAPCLFNEANQALNRASAETRGFTKKRDAYKLLSEKLRDELEAVRKEHADLVEQVRRVFEVGDDESNTVANGPNPQDQKKLDQIEQLQVEVDVVKAEAEEWKRNMDRLASEKEATRAQLTSVEVQLRTTKEKALVRPKREALEEIHARGFDLSAKINDAKVLEAMTRKLAYPKEEDSEESEDSGESEGGRDPEGDDAVPDED
uniref:Interactor of constitutive active ROPs 3-like n=1 Tax=Nicotiana tabacum TaxID=4097 RepID=A0A1S3ZTI4_TOBAC|nr:PREDICTED: interactor of constitutive active ROPs 3-like [Nicotiana tabacum]